MIAQVHTLTYMPLSCINRDESGQPKSMTVGGTRRARWSSQSQKYILRQSFRSRLPRDHVATRTRQLGTLLAAELASAGVDAETAGTLAAAYLAAAGLKTEDGRTKAILALGTARLPDVAAAIVEHRYAIDPDASRPDDAQFKPAVRVPAKGKTPESITYDKRAVAHLTEPLTDASGLVDVALFGRMLAELPGTSTDAAASVAHAFTTNADDYVTDYFTAMDDLSRDGSGHIGAQGLTSGVFYRYACVSADELACAGTLTDAAIADTVIDFVTEFAMLQPTAKEHSTAPYTVPSLVRVTLGDDQAVQHGDAFIVPVTGDLVAGSIERFRATADAKEAVFGAPGYTAEVALDAGAGTTWADMVADVSAEVRARLT